MNEQEPEDWTPYVESQMESAEQEGPHATINVAGLPEEVQQALITLASNTGVGQAHRRVLALEVELAEVATARDSAIVKAMANASDVARLEGEARETRQKLQNAEGSVRLYRRQADHNYDELRTAIKEREEVRARLENLKAEAAELRRVAAEKTRWKGLAEHNLSLLTKANRERLDHKARAEELEGQLAEVNEVLQARETDVRNLNKEIELIKGATSGAAALNAQRNHAIKERNAARAELAEAQKDRDMWQGRARQLAQDTAPTKLAQGLQEQLNSAQRQSSALRSRLADQEREMVALRNRAAQREDLIASKDHTIRVLSDLIAKMEMPKTVQPGDSAE